MWLRPSPLCGYLAAGNKSLCVGFTLTSGAFHLLVHMKALIVLRHKDRRDTSLHHHVFTTRHSSSPWCWWLQILQLISSLRVSDCKHRLYSDNWLEQKQLYVWMKFKTRGFLLKNHLYKPTRTATSPHQSQRRSGHLLNRTRKQQEKRHI